MMNIDMFDLPFNILVHVYFCSSESGDRNNSALNHRVCMDGRQSPFDRPPNPVPRSSTPTPR